MSASRDDGQADREPQASGSPMRSASWPGVEAGWGRRGEFAFRVGRREIGHLHGDHAAHFFFPKGLWLELMRAGRIGPHPVFPDREGPQPGGSPARRTSRT